jgi:hypothetical protein
MSSQEAGSTTRLLDFTLSVPPPALFTSRLTSARKVCFKTYPRISILTHTGGTPPQSWAFRACVITGTQQLLIAFLGYWGASLAYSGVLGQKSTTYAPSSVTLIAVTVPLALLMWTVGTLLFFGLPDYYRQKPGAVPSFYGALCRKGVVIVSKVYIPKRNSR